ncbi:hypothetical protein [Lachnoclostridium phytofermentans]|uniref:Uncharacterized protein n=1 Tax=Lachnoclostridium phytofermentans (strain ATCC 700394 / DSM 18823 / ISDg) TaxID=357809 RepID=A9KPI1_LACP7|nr:hypothetical protein [Lachnoclostridium phytofermentans]ABX43255.1 hypothetical protein Cphy_2897 [Lachnoclostridium phytofermentans ISDg]
MLNRKQIEQEVRKGKQLEVHLPMSLNHISSDYYAYSGMSFAMHYYNVYEMLVSGECSKGAKNHILKVNDIVLSTVLAEFDAIKREKGIKKLHELRTSILSIMQGLTSYADCFSLYEYMLNRIEPNYKNDLEDIDVEAEVKELVSVIFANEDKLVINENIRGMLSQLPVRMTKNRFYDMLKECLSIYEGSEESTVEDFIYMLRSAAGIYKPEHKEEDFPQLMEAVKRFENADYQNLSESEYKELETVLSDATSLIQVETESYYALEEAVNALYSVLLNEVYALEEAVTTGNLLKGIVKEIAMLLQKKQFTAIPEDLVDEFSVVEGKIEQYLDRVIEDEALIDLIKNDHKDLAQALMLKQQLECLVLSQSLVSNSLFIELDKQRNGKIADKSFLEKRWSELVDEFSNALSEGNKLMNRARIAATLREMPVLFSNSTEVRDYMRNSLASCRDVAERVASVSLLKQLLD